MKISKEEFAAMMGSSEEAQVSGMQPPAVNTQRVSKADFQQMFAEGEDLPMYANGITPETAINQSPISVEDRAKISVGNQAGIETFLKEKFSEVTRDRSGEFVVKDGGFWKRIDPSGLGDGDAWSKTKELLADVTDLAPEAVKIGAQIGAGVAAAATTGGASLLAQSGIAAGVGAALEAGETSLGRLVGTYQATPEEQMRDVAIEGMLNLGGTVVAAGIKPTVGFIADGLKKSANIISKVAPIGSKDSIKSFFGGISGVGAKNFDILMSDPDKVTGYMKEYAIKAANADDVVSKITAKNIQDLETIALGVRPTASSMYGKMSEEVIENAPNNFKSNLTSAVSSGQKALAEMGVGEFDKAGKFIPFSEGRLTQIMQETGTVNTLISDAPSRKIIAELSDELSKYGTAKDLSGKAGAKQVMDFKKVFNDLTQRLREEADDAALAPAQRALAAVAEAADNAIIKSFQLAQPIKSKVSGEMSDNLFLSMNGKYKEVMNEVSPLLKAVNAAKKQGGTEAYQSLYTKLNSLSGRNEVQKSGFESALSLMSQYGGVTGKVSNELYGEIQLRQAAAAFTPFTKKGLISQGGIGFGVGAAITGNLPGVAAAAGSLAATSPRIQYSVIKSAMAGNKMIRSMAPAQTGQFLSNPQVLNSFFQTIVQAPQVQEQVKSNMLNQATGGGF